MHASDAKRARPAAQRGSLQQPAGRPQAAATSRDHVTSPAVAAAAAAIHQA